MSEVDRVRERYARRRELDESYDNLAPDHYLAEQAKTARCCTGCEPAGWLR